MLVQEVLPASLQWFHVLNLLLLACTSPKTEPCISNTQFLEEDLWPFVSTDCLSCHQEGGPAGQSAFILTANQQDSEEIIWSIATQTIGNSQQSSILSKARGLSNHGGGMRVQQNSAEERLIKEWDARAQGEICQFETSSAQLLKVDTPIVRLSPIQIQNTIARAFGEESLLGTVPTIYIQEAEYKNREGYTTAELQALQNYFTQVIANIISQQDECEDDSCLEEWLFAKLKILIRRPLSTTEKDIYLARITQEENIEEALEHILLSALLTPQFLYRNSLQSIPSLPIEYDHLEKITYFLWDAPPTAQMLEEVENGTWNIDSFENLLSDPQTSQTVARVHRDWLGAGKILGRRKDSDQYPNYQIQHAQDVLQEFMLFSQSSYEEEPTLRYLFTSRSGWVNPTIATIYRVEHDSSDWNYMQLPEERGGILSRASVIASHTTSLHNLIPHRGHMLMRRLFCQEYGLAPNSFSIDTLPPGEPMAPQDMIAMHQSNQVCASCHMHIDPIGLALDNYDALGFWDSSLNTAGDFSTFSFSFSNLQDLQEQLTQQPELYQCYTQVWLERAKQNHLSDNDIAWARRQGTYMHQQQASIPSLLSSIIRANILNEYNP